MGGKGTDGLQCRARFYCAQSGISTGRARGHAQYPWRERNGSRQFASGASGDWRRIVATGSSARTQFEFTKVRRSR